MSTALLASAGEEKFREVVESADNIAEGRSATLLDTVVEWDPESDDMIDVPFSFSIRQESDSDSVTRFHTKDTTVLTGDDSGSTDTPRATTLADFD